MIKHLQTRASKKCLKMLLNPVRTFSLRTFPLLRLYYPIRKKVVIFSHIVRQFKKSQLVFRGWDSGISYNVFCPGFRRNTCKVSCHLAPLGMSIANVWALQIIQKPNQTPFLSNISCRPFRPTDIAISIRSLACHSFKNFGFIERVDKD